MLGGNGLEPGTIGLVRMPQAPRYSCPDFLLGEIDQEKYEKWLRRKALAQLNRDRKRGNSTSQGVDYRDALHSAVIESRGLDYFTGERLDWTLISKYDNEESRSRRREYKKAFAMLPTVDHENDGTGSPRFRICGWRTNDAKSDMTHSELVEFCRKVLNHSRGWVSSP